MGNVQNQDCLLCDIPAKFEYRDFNHRKHFLCTDCGEYQITISAEERLKNLGNPELLTAAKSDLRSRVRNVSPNMMLDISENRQGDSIFNFEEVPKTNSK